MSTTADIVPVILTERLKLRRAERRDFAPFAEVFASPRSVHMGGPLGSKDAWSIFAAGPGQWLILGFGAWSIEERSSGKWCGEVALNRPAHFPENEIGWMLAEWAEGRGFAREAAAAALAWVWANLGWKTLVSYIDPQNTGSIRLAERLGAKHDPDAATPEGDACVVYRHFAPEAA